MNNKKGIEAQRHKGRAKIDSTARTHGSRRAREGKLEVVRRFCPKCSHYKAFRTRNLFKCSRCGYEFHRSEGVWGL